MSMGWYRRPLSSNVSSNAPTTYSASWRSAEERWEMRPAPTAGDKWNLDKTKRLFHLETYSLYGMEENSAFKSFRG